MEGTARVTLRQRRAAETRLLVLEAAAQVFARRGYAQASMDDVAAEAGASKGALYHHFATKRALFQALLSHRADQLQPLRQVGDDADSLPQALDQLVGLYLERARGDPAFVALALESRLQAIRERAAAEVLGSYYQEIRQELDRAVRRIAKNFGGRPPPEEQLGGMVFAVLDGVCQQWAVDPKRVDLRALRRPVVQLLLCLLTPRDDQLLGDSRQPGPKRV